MKRYQMAELEKQNARLKEMVERFVQVADTNSGVWTPMAEPLEQARALLLELQEAEK